MKAALIPKPGQLVMEDIPNLGPLQDYEVRVQTLFAATCTGTDSKLIADKTPWPNTYPAVLGHETTGEVIEVGPKVRNLAVGDVVLRPVYVFPGEEQNGLHSAFGGFSEQGVVLDRAAMLEDGGEDTRVYSKYQLKLPPHWRDQPGSVMLITLKETFSWLQGMGSLYGKDVGIVGAGAVGLFFTKVAALFCAKSITVMARSDRGFERARAMGATDCLTVPDQAPEGAFDVLIDAAGVSSQIKQFVPMVKNGGLLGIYGIDDSDQLVFDGVGNGIRMTFHSAKEDCPLVHDTCIRLVDQGFINLDDFYTATMAFDQIPEAFERLRNKQELKVVFRT